MTLLDFLQNRFPYHNKEAWNLRISELRVWIGDRPGLSTEILSLGEAIHYKPNPEFMIEPPVATDFKVLETRDSFYVIDKPPNLPMHPAGRYRENTLLHLLRKAFPKEELSPLHRIDRETSGLVLVSRVPNRFVEYQKLFEERRISKSYLAIVFGKFPTTYSAKGILFKDSQSSIRKKMKWTEKQSKDQTNDLWAITDFQLSHFDANQNISLVKCFPITGRIHQIRATLLGLGYPIVGDKLYGKDETAFLDFARSGDSEDFSLRLGHSRQALHAEKLTFIDPIDQRMESFHSPLPLDLKKIMSPDLSKELV